MNRRYELFMFKTALFLALFGAVSGIRGEIKVGLECQDLGAVPLQTMVSKVIHVSNSSRDALEIKKLIPSCSCLSLKTGTVTIPGNGTAEIEVMIKGGDDTGSRKEAIGISWSYLGDEEVHTSLIPISFVVDTKVEIDKRSIDFGVVGQNEGVVKTLSILPVRDSDEWDEIRVKANQYIETNIRRLTSGGYEVKIKPANVPYPQSEVKTSLVLQFLKSGKLLRYRRTVPISLTVLNDRIKASVHSIYLGEVTPNTVREVVVVVSGLDASEARIESSNDAISIIKEEADPSGRVKCHVKFNAYGKVGSFKEAILISSDKSARALEIPIVGYVM